jgi:hypothetical protein
MSSLQQYTDDMEYIDGTEKFELESLLVKLTVETQRRLYLEEREHQNSRSTCKFTNKYTYAGRERRVHCYIIRDITMTCKDLSLSWTICEQTLIRNDLMRKLKLCDLRHKTSHGPSIEGIESHMIPPILEEVVRAISKHTTPKIGKCYVTELFPEVLRGMGGFEKDDIVPFSAPSQPHPFPNSAPSYAPSWAPTSTLSQAPTSTPSSAPSQANISAPSHNPSPALSIQAD